MRLRRATFGLSALAFFVGIGSASGQQPVLTTYSGANSTLTTDPQSGGLSGGGATGVAQPVSLKWRHRGVGLDGTWREPWATAQLAANPGDPAALGDMAVGEVRLATGEYAPTEIDLNLPSIGPEWVIGRSRRSLSAAGGSMHGAGWNQMSQAQLVYWDRSGSSNDVVFLVYGGDRYAEFRRVMNGNSATQTFRGVNGAAGAFTCSAPLGGGAQPLSGSPEPDLPAISTWTYHDPAGITVTFLGAEATRSDTGGGTHVGKWQVWKITDAEGYTAYVGDATSADQAVLDGYDASGRIVKAYDSAGRRYDYTYGTPGGASRLMSVTATLGTTVVASVEYTYYTTTGDGGTIGDLFSATTLVPTAGDFIRHTTVYRYWNASASTQSGFGAGPTGSVRLVIPPETVRLATAGAGLGSLPSWTDTQWGAEGATRFGYDAASKVDKVVGDALPDRAMTIRYETPTTAVSSTNGYDNTWASRAVVLDTYVDTGGTLTKRATTTYLDELGQALSSVVTASDPASSTTNFWCTYVERDANGCVGLIGTPASVQSYTHATGSATITANSTGLVRRFIRFGQTGGSTNTTLAGFVEKLAHSQAWTGTTTNDVAFAYRAITSNARPCKVLTAYTIYRPLIEGVTRYPSATGQTTTLAYTLPDSTVAPAASSAALTIDWILTTHPVVSWAQHGSGTADVSAVAFSRNGLVTHVRSMGTLNASTGVGIPGTMTYRVYDSATGLLATLVEDSSASCGFGPFPSPSANPQNQITSYAQDDQGRTTVVDEFGYETRVIAHSMLADGRPVTVEGIQIGGAYASPGSYQVRNLRGAEEASGNVVFSGTPSGGIYTTSIPPSAWVATASSDAVHPLAAGAVGSPRVTEYGPGGVRPVARRAYFTVPSSGAGTTSHYDRSEMLYDVRGLLVRSIDPSRTIMAFGYDTLDRTTGLWRGIEPSGGGETLQVLVTYEYDGGLSGGNGLATKVIRHANGLDDASDDRTTQLFYDDQSRVRAVVNPASPHMLFARDNFGRVTAAGFYSLSPSSLTDPTASDTSRLGFQTRDYDALGRVYRQDEVMGSSTTLADGIGTDTYYDPRGRTSLVMGRTTTQYSYADSSGACGCTASTVSMVAKTELPSSYATTLSVQSADVVLQESHTIWAANGRDVAGYATVERHPASAMIWRGVTSETGPLSESEFILAGVVNYTKAPNGRVSTRFIGRDELHRAIADVDFGNAGYENGLMTTPLRSLADLNGVDPFGSATLPPSPYKGTFTAYAASGFVAAIGNERGDRTDFERDQLGRETQRTSLRGGGQLPLVSGAEQACAIPKIEKTTYDKGRPVLYCAGTDVNCEKLMQYEYPDTAGSGFPFASVNMMLDNNVPRTILYPASMTPGASSVPGLGGVDRTDFARNALGEPLAMQDKAGVQVWNMIAPSTGWETQRHFTYPSVTDALGMALTDNTVKYLEFSRDGWGRVTNGEAFGQDENIIGRDPMAYDDWGNPVFVGQDIVRIPDGDNDGDGNNDGFSTPNLTGLGVGLEYDLVNDTNSPGSYWRGHRPAVRDLPGTTYPNELDERFYYSGTFGVPPVSSGGVNGSVDVDATVGRPTKTTYGPESIENVDYFGIYKPAITWRGSAGMERILYAPYLGMALKPGDPNYPNPTGLSPWGEQETDYWRYCGAANPCTDPPGVESRTPRIGRDSTMRPHELCAAVAGDGNRCEIRIEDTTDPRDNRQVDIECATRVTSEYTGPSPGSQNSVLPNNNRRVDYWIFDEDQPTKGRGNPTTHKRLLDTSDPDFTDTVSKAGEFLDERQYTRADQVYTGERAEGTGSGTGAAVYTGPRHDPRGHLRSEGGLEGSRAFQYDAVGRLTEVRKLNGSGLATDAGAIAAKFTYDGMGRRTSARYAKAGSSATIADDTADLYLYDEQWRVAAVVQAMPVLDGGGAPTGAMTTRVRERYLYSPLGGHAGGDTPIGREIDSDGDGIFERREYYLADRQGSVVGVVERLDTDFDGVPNTEPRLIARIAYSAYGEPEIYRPTDADRNGVVNSSDLDWFTVLYLAYDNGDPGTEVYQGYLDWDHNGTVDAADLALFDDDLDLDIDIEIAHGTAAQQLGAMPLYAGYWWDPELRLYHVRHRVYDPYTSRWLQRDPIGYEGGPNLYQYCGGEPWKYTDPTGLYIEITENSGTLNRQKGTFYHYYDRGWTGIFKNEHIGTVFVPDGGGSETGRTDADDVLDEQVKDRHKRIDSFVRAGSIAKDGLEIVQTTGAVALAVLIPGPEDAVIAVLMSAKAIRFFAKIGDEIIGVTKGGKKVALTAEEAATVKKTMDARDASRAEACAPPSLHVPAPLREDQAETIVLWGGNNHPPLRPGEAKLDLTPRPEWNDLPQSARERLYWERNRDSLERVIERKQSIRDSYVDTRSDGTFVLRPRPGSFLERERNLLTDSGYQFDPRTAEWVPK